MKDFADAFRDDREPMRIDRSQLTAAKSHWQSRIAAIPGVQMTYHAGDRDARCRVLCRFLVPDPTQRLTYFRRDEFRIQHDDAGIVGLYWEPPAIEGESSFPLESMNVSSICQVDDLVDQMLKRFHAEAAVRRKRERIRSLRIKAMESRLSTLAGEIKSELNWKLATDTVKVCLGKESEPIYRWTRTIDSFEQEFSNLRSDIIQAEQAATLGDAQILLE